MHFYLGKQLEDGYIWAVIIGSVPGRDPVRVRVSAGRTRTGTCRIWPTH